MALPFADEVWYAGRFPKLFHVFPSEPNLYLVWEFAKQPMLRLYREI